MSEPRTSPGDDERPGLITLFGSILPYKRAWLSRDVIAGITLAALAIPEVMGYTKIAGTPVITGLYTILIPVLAFAVFGSSRHLVVGGDSATAAIMYAGIAALGIAGLQPNTSQWVALASTSALLAAVLLFLSRLARLGFLADFISRTVLIGFPKGVTWTEAVQLIAVSTSMFLVILAQSAATSRAYAVKYRERFVENDDLVGLSAANLAAGFSGTFVVNGSPTKTEMVDQAKSRTQVAQLTTAAVVAFVVLFLTKPLQYLPNAVLSAVVFLIGIKLIDITHMREILRLRKDEFWVAAVTAAVVVCIGVEQGIILAIVLS